MYAMRQLIKHTSLFIGVITLRGNNISLFQRPSPSHWGGVFGNGRLLDRSKNMKNIPGLKSYHAHCLRPHFIHLGYIAQIDSNYTGQKADTRSLKPQDCCLRTTLTVAFTRPVTYIGSTFRYLMILSTIALVVVH